MASYNIDIDKVREVERGGGPVDILVVIYGFICVVVGAGAVYTKIVHSRVSAESLYISGKYIAVVGLAITFLGIAITTWGMCNIFLNLPEIFKIV